MTFTLHELRAIQKALEFQRQAAAEPSRYDLTGLKVEAKIEQFFASCTCSTSGPCAVHPLALVAKGRRRKAA